MPNLFEPIGLLETVGILGLFAIIFAESGLFFGFFLPGDSLLFTAGFLASQGFAGIGLVALGCAAAAILGDNVGYAFGRRVGPRLFSREDSFFFRRKHLERAEDFYEKHGKKTIVLARFVPVVRTFAPILAGVGGMEYRTFFTWNVIGGLIWGAGLPLLGYFLGSIFPAADRYILLIIALVILISFLPVIRPLYRRLKSKF